MWLGTGRQAGIWLVLEFPRCHLLPTNKNMLEGAWWLCRCCHAKRDAALKGTSCKGLILLLVKLMAKLSQISEKKDWAYVILGMVTVKAFLKEVFPRKSGLIFWSRELFFLQAEIRCCGDKGTRGSGVTEMAGPLTELWKCVDTFAEGMREAFFTWKARGGKEKGCCICIIYNPPLNLWISPCVSKKESWWLKYNPSPEVGTSLPFPVLSTIYNRPLELSRYIKKNPVWLAPFSSWLCIYLCNVQCPRTSLFRAGVKV